MVRSCSLWLWFALAGCLLASAPGFARPARRVLVLYDNGPVKEPSDAMGAITEQLLRNLLGHFAVRVTTRPVTAYRRGEIAQYDATFYLGVVRHGALPASFTHDVAASQHTVCWIDEHLGQLADLPTFTRRYGVKYLGMDKDEYTDFRYRVFRFTRHLDDPVLGKLQILDRRKARVVATCATSDTETPPVPYITQTANLWYVADNPFYNAGDEDRYLIFADVLHDILGIHHREQHRAMVRLEDIHPLTPPAKLREIGDLFRELGVPFSIALIPEYRDPRGVENHGVPRKVRLDEMPQLVETLHYLERCGGSIVLHGYTHQFSDKLNPYSGLSAEDSEFMREVRLPDGTMQDTPVPGDCARWVRTRLRLAHRILDRCGLKAVAWNTPHYIASETDYRELARHFTRFVDSGQYYAVDPAGKLVGEGQMMPYVLRDVYGCLRIPETLGYFNFTATDDEALRRPEEMLKLARAQLGVRDGWASFFFHIDKPLAAVKETILGLKAMGYTFVPVTSVPEFPAKKR